MLIVGDQEAQDQTISVRKHGGEEIGAISVEGFAQLVKKEIETTLKPF